MCALPPALLGCRRQHCVRLGPVPAGPPLLLLGGFGQTLTAGNVGAGLAKPVWVWQSAARGACSLLRLLLQVLGSGVHEKAPESSPETCNRGDLTDSATCRTGAPTMFAAAARPCAIRCKVIAVLRSQREREVRTRLYCLHNLYHGGHAHFPPKDGPFPSVNSYRPLPKCQYFPIRS